MKKLLTLIITLVLLLACGFMAAFVTAISVGVNTEGRVFAGENVTLKTGHQIDDDVVIFGGNLTMEEESRIRGDLAMFGGHADIDGTVDGEIALTGGNLSLGPQANIAGDIGLIGGNVTGLDQAQVGGEVHTFGGHQDRYGSRSDRANQEREERAERVAPPSPPERPSSPRVDEAHYDDDDDHWRDNYDYDYYDRHDSPSILGAVGGFIIGLIKMVVSTLALLAISWLVAALLPEQMKTVSDTVVDNVLVSFGVGLATLLVAIASLILICLLFPVLLWFVMLLAILFGWIAIAQLVGERLLVALDRPFPNFTTSTMVGVVVLTLISQLPETVGFLFCIGGLLGFLAGIVTFVIATTGLGAVVLTRFGTQAYSQSPPNYAPFNSSGSYRPRTRWPDPDLDLDEELEPKPKSDPESPADEPKPNNVDLNKPTDEPPTPPKTDN